MIIAGLLLVGGFCLASHHETHYTRQAEVVEINDGGTWFEDSLGNIWSVTDEIHTLEIGEVVMLNMNTNLTTEVKDDSIETIQRVNGERFKA